jgi:hypothetical protein
MIHPPVDRHEPGQMVVAGDPEQPLVGHAPVLHGGLGGLVVGLGHEAAVAGAAMPRGHWDLAEGMVVAVLAVVGMEGEGAAGGEVASAGVQRRSRNECRRKALKCFY